MTTRMMEKTTRKMAAMAMTTPQQVVQKQCA
jgi:hypothetical protein